MNSQAFSSTLKYRVKCYVGAARSKQYKFLNINIKSKAAEVVTETDPCASITITPFSDSMEISLGKDTNAFEYILARTAVSLDNGKVYSSA